MATMTIGQFKAAFPDLDREKWHGQTANNADTRIAMASLGQPLVRRDNKWTIYVARNGEEAA